MIKNRYTYYWLLLMSLVWVLLAGCSTTAVVADTESLEPANITTDELMALIPDYQKQLFTISGSGRAIVSEPGNSERVSIQFQSNRQESFIQVRSGHGIEGGQIYVDSDSLMVYNRLDKKAEKVSIQQGNLSSVGSLASVNLVDLFNYTIDPDTIDKIFLDSNSFVLLLTNRTLIRISTRNGIVESVVHANENRSAPYSRLEYEGYATIDQLLLPRRITIYSKDGHSRATLLVQRLEINPTLPPLGIDLPDDIPIQRL